VRWLLGAVAFAQEVKAQTVCGTLDGNGNVILCGNGNPDDAVAGWGLTGAQTKKVVAGTEMVDEAGYKAVCPAWYGKLMCADITRTEYYRKAHVEVARQLKEKNLLSKFPGFSYWATLVK
jgi:hypothetical protein